MFNLVKKGLILVLMSSNSENNITKSITGNFIKISGNITKNPSECFLLKNEECKVKKNNC